MGGPATSATFTAAGVAIDPSGGIVIADQGNHFVLYVATGAGTIAVVAGNGTAAFSGDGGPATAATVNRPQSVAVGTGGDIFVSDTYNYRIRRIAGGTGIISTVAGVGTQGSSGDGGPPTAAQLFLAYGLAVDANGGSLYIADYNANRVRRVSLASNVITTVAGGGGNGLGGYTGDGGPATAAKLYGPIGVAVDANYIYISDSMNNVIHRVSLSTDVTTTLGGNGTMGYGGDGGPTTARR